MPLHNSFGPVERELIAFLREYFAGVDCQADQVHRPSIHWLETHTPQDDVTGDWFYASFLEDDDLMASDQVVHLELDQHRYRCMEPVAPVVHGLSDDDLDYLTIVEPSCLPAQFALPWVYQDALGPIIP